MTTRIGIDLGGSKIAAIALDVTGQALGHERAATPGGYDDLLKQLATLVQALESKHGTASVGIGIPGFVIPDERETVFAPNVKALIGKPFRRDLSQLLGREVRVANDAACLSLSEARDGAAAGAGTVFGIILGTGVGGGFCLNKKIVDGANGFKEWAHLPMPWRRENEPELRCGCGRMGCIETLCNGAALTTLYRQHTGKDAAGEAIGAAAAAGDVAALAVLDIFYERVGRALMLPIHVLDPDVIVLGGGLSRLPDIAAKAREQARLLAFGQSLRTQVCVARHGADSGQRAAAWLW